jgi:hypothetical protein
LLVGDFKYSCGTEGFQAEKLQAHADVCRSQEVRQLEATLAETRAEADGRLSKIRAELSAVRSEAAARARDLENQLADARVSKSVSPRQESLAKVQMGPKIAASVLREEHINSFIPLA